jgi:hypothetical protein
MGKRPGVAAHRRSGARWRPARRRRRGGCGGGPGRPRVGGRAGRPKANVQVAGPKTEDGPKLKKKKFLSNFKLNLGIWLDFENLHKEI